MFCHWVHFGTKIAGYLNKIGNLVRKLKMVFCGSASADPWDSWVVGATGIREYPWPVFSTVFLFHVIFHDKYFILEQ
jgi:hypothetical protein